MLTFEGYKDEVRKHILKYIGKEEIKQFDEWLKDKSVTKYVNDHYMDYLDDKCEGVPSTFAYALRMESEWAN